MKLIVRVIPLYHSGVGYAGLVNAAWLNIYYIVILAWCMFYFLVSLNSRKSNKQKRVLDFKKYFLVPGTMIMLKCYQYSIIYTTLSLLITYFPSDSLSELWIWTLVWRRKENGFVWIDYTLSDVSQSWNAVVINFDWPHRYHRFPSTLIIWTSCLVTIILNILYNLFKLVKIGEQSLFELKSVLKLASFENTEIVS